jgi:hypothetical protein
MSSDTPNVVSALDARLASLSAEAPPSRDLWPGILAAISAEKPRAARSWQQRWPYALAAGIVGAIAVGYVGWLGGRQSQPAVASAPPPATAAESLRQASFAVPAGRDYLATRSELERMYHERLELLAPATRARIDQDLLTIRAANEDIRRSLASDPQSPVLNRLLDSIWQQEFDLYATVARSTEPAAQRTRT